MPIPLSQPDLTEAEIAAVLEVLHSPRLALGPRVTAFEEALAAHTGCRFGVAVNSGTSALHLIVRALGIGEGDEVITTPFSFVASANCVLYERAVPVFVDIDPVTLNLNPALIEAAITPRTRALLAVDVFGRPADWTALHDLARRHNLLLIEDSCEAIGARYRLPDGSWARCGSLADAGCFAFYPNKQITTGEGGMVVTDREEVARLCRSMSNQGRDEGAGWLQHARLGYNYRLSDLNCALGVAQLARLDEILAARRQVAAWYTEALADLPQIETPVEQDGEAISWFVYVVRLTEGHSRADRDAVLGHLRARGIGCNDYFTPIHLQPYMREQLGYAEGDFPVTESVSARTVALPFYNRLTREQVGEVVSALRSAVDVLGAR